MEVQDPSLKTETEEDEVPEEEPTEEDLEDDLDDGEEHEFTNPGDLDAVDPDEIALGEEYL